MALTDDQIAFLNKASNTLPELGKNKQPAGQEILLGDLLAVADGLAGVTASNVSAVATADGDATYGQPEADLLNEVKAKLNLVITALNQVLTAARG